MWHCAKGITIKSKNDQSTVTGLLIYSSMSPGLGLETGHAYWITLLSHPATALPTASSLHALSKSSTTLTVSSISCHSSTLSFITSTSFFLYYSSMHISTLNVQHLPHFHHYRCYIFSLLFSDHTIFRSLPWTNAVPLLSFTCLLCLLLNTRITPWPLHSSW